MSSSWSSQCFRRVAQTAACSSSWPMQRTIWELQTCKTNSSWLLIQSRSRLPVNFPINSCCIMSLSNILQPIHWWNVCFLEWHSSLTLLADPDLQRFFRSWLWLHLARFLLWCHVFLPIVFFHYFPLPLIFCTCSCSFPNPWQFKNIRNSEPANIPAQEVLELHHRQQSEW